MFRFEVLVGGCGRHLNWRNSNFSFSSQKKKLKIQNQGFPSRLLPVLKSHPHPHAASSSGAQYSGNHFYYAIASSSSSFFLKISK